MPISDEEVLQAFEILFNELFHYSDFSGDIMNSVLCAKDDEYTKEKLKTFISDVYWKGYEDCRYVNNLK